MLKKILTVIIILGIIFRIAWLLYNNREKYSPDYWVRYPTLKTVYGESQYRMKTWKYWIPDETVYSYAGGAYFKGANPIIVESTQPPLGKYLIALSILLSKSENAIVPVFFVFLIIGIYALSFQITGSMLISLVVVLFSVFERMFTDQLSITPLLDIFLITFLVYGIAAMAFALEKRKPEFLLISYSCFGAVLMIKVWLIGAAFVVPITLYIFILARKYYMYVIYGLIIMLGIALGSYTKMFMDGYNIVQVLLVQKWLFWYQNGKRSGLMTIWPLIFLNKWFVWWGDNPIIKDPNWSFSWPIVIAAGILASIRVCMKHLRTTRVSLHLTAISILAYSVFMSLGQASARYLLPILPFCYVMGGWLLYTLSKRFSVMKKIL